MTTGDVTTGSLRILGAGPPLFLQKTFDNEGDAPYRIVIYSGSSSEEKPLTAENLRTIRAWIDARVGAA